MIRFVKWVGISIVILTMLITSLWISLPYWITPFTKLFLPAELSIAIEATPTLIKNGVFFKSMRLTLNGCRLSELNDVSISYRHANFVIDASKINVNSKCLQNLPPSNDAIDAPLSLGSLTQLPMFDLTVDDLDITPWTQYPGRLSVSHRGEYQKINYESSLLSFATVLNPQTSLTIESARLRLAESDETLSLDGTISVPLALNTLPEQGSIAAKFNSLLFKKPLLLDLNWNRLVGSLRIKEQDNGDSLLYLPWHLTENRLDITEGHWTWPYSSMPLSGGITLSLADWAKDYSNVLLEGRINILTRGAGGKANLVLSFGPEKIGLTDNDFNFQLTGKAGFEQIATYVSIPATFNDSLLNPTIRIKPGALLRATGKALSNISLHEARFPLAGISITRHGLNGRLQAIISASHYQWGSYRVHLDGKAQEFLADTGLWQWKFWGSGRLPKLKAKWDVAGNGQWLNRLIHIEKMSTGFDKLRYGRVKVEKPRLLLIGPFIWQYDKRHFNANVQLKAGKVSFDKGGYLPNTQLTLSLKGTTPNHFVWNGQLNARPIGPVKLNGRWDGQRLRGQAWWPKQPLTVFQSLLPADSEIKIRGGTLHAQSAFSATEAQGFQAGGHFVVNGGSLWLKEGALNGLDFTASYLFKNHLWRLGNKGPIRLTIAQLTNLFDMQNITAHLQGSYPHSDKNPLILSHVALDMLGGHISMSDFRLPQNRPTILKLENIELSRLLSVLKPKQIAMSGRINGELPLYVNNPEWLIKGGWIENSGSLTLRVDTDFIDAIAKDNLATGAVMDWLRYVEISRSRADVNVNNLGILSMDMQIKGINSLKSKVKPVVLNYHHEENIFQLWQSLRFGDNLQDWLAQQLPSDKEKKGE